jgi:hypothetical protein
VFLQISANGVLVENVDGGKESQTRFLCSGSGETTRVTFLVEHGPLPSLEPGRVDGSLDLQVLLLSPYSACRAANRLRPRVCPLARSSLDALSAATRHSPSSTHACVLFRPRGFNVCVAFAWLRQVAAGGNASYFYPWIKSVAGSKEELKCSGRGTCDRRNALLQGAGLCTCFHAFEASDKRGQEGFEPDCG